MCDGVVWCVVMCVGARVLCSVLYCAMYRGVPYYVALLRIRLLLPQQLLWLACMITLVMDRRMARAISNEIATHHSANSSIVG